MEADYEEVENFDTVFKKIEQAAENRIEKGIDVPDYMGILREEIEKMIMKNITIPEDQAQKGVEGKMVW